MVKIKKKSLIYLTFITLLFFYPPSHTPKVQRTIKFAQVYVFAYVFSAIFLKLFFQYWGSSGLPAFFMFFYEKKKTEDCYYWIFVCKFSCLNFVRLKLAKKSLFLLLGSFSRKLWNSRLRLVFLKFWRRFY